MLEKLSLITRVETAGHEPRGRRFRAGLSAPVALLLLSFLAGVAWADAPASEGGRPADGTIRTESPAGADVPSDRTRDVHAARPHPRGLPRKGGLPSRGTNVGRRSGQGVRPERRRA